MSTTTLPQSQLNQLPPEPVYRFTVDEYHRLGEAGVLTEDHRVELLEGWIIQKMVHNPPHDGTIELCHDLLRSHLPEGWRIRIQSSVTTLESEPEPDLAVVRGTKRSYIARHPEPEDVGLIIEVASASLSRDRGIKARLYARAGIPVYWVVNLADRQLEVFTDPAGGGAAARYRGLQTLGADDEVPLVLDGNEIARLPVHDLLP